MNLSNRLSAVLGSRLPYPALLMGLGLPLIAEGIIVTVGKTEAPVLWLLGLGFAAIVSGLLLAHWWWRPPVWAIERVTGEVARPSRWLVVTPSLGQGSESAAVTAVKHHRPCLERVVALHTEDPRGRKARDIFRENIEALAGSSATIEFAGMPLNPKATEDPEIVYETIEGIFRAADEAGVPPHEVMLAITCPRNSSC